MAVFHVRRLPHYHYLDRPTFFTWRLRASLPPGRRLPESEAPGQAFVAVDRLLDSARAGPLHLRQPEIAAVFAEAIHYHARDLQHFQLHAYVVMANHVHLLVTPLIEVSKLLQSLKRFTAREANRLLGQTGQAFWQDESYDRLVRDEDEFQRIVRYIEWNPVSAGLVSTPEEFLWSSARPIDNRPAGCQPAPQNS